MVRLDIFSDPICPWCFIGKKNLDDTLEKTHEGTFDIKWHLFQLNPHMPGGGMDRRVYLQNKFGGKEGVIKAYTKHVERSSTYKLARS